MSTRDWKDTAQAIIAETYYYCDDTTDIWDECYEHAWQTSDNMCIYYHDCEDYCAELEDYDTDLDDCGLEYKASDWKQAQQAHAFNLVRARLEAEIHEILSETEDAIEEFNDWALDISKGAATLVFGDNELERYPVLLEGHDYPIRSNGAEYCALLDLDFMVGTARWQA